MAAEQERAAGTVVQISDDGFGYVLDDATRRLFVFMFDALPGYAGQSTGEMGLHVGTQVEFVRRGNCVAEVVPLSASARAAAR